MALSDYAYDYEYDEGWNDYLLNNGCDPPLEADRKSAYLQGYSDAAAKYPQGS